MLAPVVSSCPVSTLCCCDTCIGGFGVERCRSRAVAATAEPKKRAFKPREINILLLGASWGGESVDGVVLQPMEKSRAAEEKKKEWKPGDGGASGERAMIKTKTKLATAQRDRLKRG